MTGPTAYARIATLCLTLVASSAMAQQADPLRTFANCAGRLSAVVEYQWMFDGPQSEQTAKQRDTILELLHAVMPEDRGREVLNWRLSAKLAQSTLLNRATFNTDAEDAARALRTSDRMIRACTLFLLS